MEEYFYVTHDGRVPNNGVPPRAGKNAWHPSMGPPKPSPPAFVCHPNGPEKSSSPAYFCHPTGPPKPPPQHPVVYHLNGPPQPTPPKMVVCHPVTPPPPPQPKGYMRFPGQKPKYIPRILKQKLVGRHMGEPEPPKPYVCIEAQPPIQPHPYPFPPSGYYEPPPAAQVVHYTPPDSPPPTYVELEPPSPKYNNAPVEGNRVKGMLAVLGDRQGLYIFPKKPPCTFHVSKGTVKPWQPKMQGFEPQFVVAHAPVDMTIREFIDRVGAIEKAGRGTPKEQIGVAEFIDTSGAGMGHWRMGTKFTLASRNAELDLTLEEVGWNSEKGTKGQQPPVWLALLP